MCGHRLVNTSPAANGISSSWIKYEPRSCGISAISTPHVPRNATRAYAALRSNRRAATAARRLMLSISCRVGSRRSR